MSTSIIAPTGWSTDESTLGTQTYWAETGDGQRMARMYGLNKAIPRMCLTGGEILYLVEAGSSFYFWNPIDVCLWKITHPGGLQEIVQAIDQPNGLSVIEKEIARPMK